MQADEEERFLKALNKLAPVDKESDVDPITGRVSVRLGPGVSPKHFESNLSSFKPRMAE